MFVLTLAVSGSQGVCNKRQEKQSSTCYDKMLPVPLDSLDCLQHSIPLIMPHHTWSQTAGPILTSSVKIKPPSSVVCKCLRDLILSCMQTLWLSDTVLCWACCDDGSETTAMLIWTMLDQGIATCLLWSWITLIGSLVDLSASSVIIVGNRYYYDVTYMLWSRQFQVVSREKIF